MSGNIFDLEKNAPKKEILTTNKKEISQEEKDRLLTGYVQIPYEQWSGIKKYWHIR